MKIICECNSEIQFIHSLIVSKHSAQTQSPTPEQATETKTQFNNLQQDQTHMGTQSLHSHANK